MAARLQPLAPGATDHLHEFDAITSSSAYSNGTAIASGHGEEHHEPLLYGARDKTARSHVSERLGWDNLLASSREMGHRTLFVCLTVLSFVMVALNIIQAALIDRIHSIVWILYVPLIFFLTAVLVIAGIMVASRRHLLEQWKDAEVSKRVAWIGIVLSILMTIVLCQFYYLPYVALPAWHKTKWTNDFDIPKYLVIPALVIAWTGEPNALQFSGLNCNFPKDNSGHPGDPCSQVPINNFSSSNAQSGQYMVLNSTSFVPHVFAHQREGFQVLAAWDMLVTYDCKVLQHNIPQISMALFDASLHFDMSEMIAGCGNPPIYSVLSLSARPDMSFSVKAAANSLHDEIGALLDQPSTGGDNLTTPYCTPETLALTRYNYFTATWNADPVVAGILNDSCAGVIDDSLTSTELRGSMSMSTSTVFTQTSQHGTSTLQILIDEGSILGAISFFAWFFSIFVD